MLIKLPSCQWISKFEQFFAGLGKAHVKILFIFGVGLLALYLCTRNCCGLILNLFFAALSTACGIALFYSGFSRPLGIMLITVGILMTIGIIVAYVYHKVTGNERFEKHPNIPNAVHVSLLWHFRFPYNTRVKRPESDREQELRMTYAYFHVCIRLVLAKTSFRISTSTRCFLAFRRSRSTNYSNENLSCSLTFQLIILKWMRLDYESF